MKIHVFGILFHVCSGAKIGSVSLSQNVFVGNRVVISDHCKVQNNVSVYDNVVLEEERILYLNMVLPMYTLRSLMSARSIS